MVTGSQLEFEIVIAGRLVFTHRWQFFIDVATRNLKNAAWNTQEYNERPGVVWGAPVRMPYCGACGGEQHPRLGGNTINGPHVFPGLGTADAVKSDEYTSRAWQTKR